MKFRPVLTAMGVLVALLYVFQPHGALGAEGAVEIEPFKANGAVVGTRVKIDENYTKKYNVPVPAPFEFIVPRSKDILVFAAFPPQTAGEFIKLSFATKDKQLIENLRFTTMSVPQSNADERLKKTADLLVSRGLPMALKGFANQEFKGARQAKVGPYDAVEVSAEYTESSLGAMMMILVGILNPDSKDCIMAFANVVPGRSEAKAVQEIGVKSIVGRVIGTFRFIKP